MSEITWIKQGDDYSAKVGGYELSARKIGEDWWSYQVDYYLLSAKSTIDGGWESSAEEAKKQAEQAYLEHIKK